MYGPNQRNYLPSGINTKELALISLFSALWISAQVTLGPVIGQVTQMHGVIQRVVGWLLMLVLADLTGKFGRVTLMTTIAAIATRMIRRTASLYPWVLAVGYIAGGLIFDILFFTLISRSYPRKRQDNTHSYGTILISLISGVFALIPYIAFQWYTLDRYTFALRLPTYIFAFVKGVSFTIFGTLIGLSIIPRLALYKMKN